MHFSPMTKVVSLVSAGLLSAIGGITFYIYLPSLIKSEISKKLVLNEDSFIYDYWKNVPLPIYTRFYFFSVVNPMDVYENLAKPILEEHGPYTFRETRVKFNITWHNNGTVSYRQLKRYFFRPELTNGSLDDVITTLNVPMMAVASKVKKLNSFFANFAVSAIFETFGSTWFVRKSIRELLFEGYDDPIMEQAKQFVTLELDKFGYMYKRNNSDDGYEFSIFTGETGVEHLIQTDNFKGSPLNLDAKPPCQEVRGSAGEVYSPFSLGEKVDIFSPDICRVVSLYYSGTHSVNGMDARRYYADHRTFDNGQYNATNKCYCVDKCLPPGVQDIQNCGIGPPAVASFPHFLYADSSYAQNFEGLKPDPKKHLFYLDLEKSVGIPLGGSAGIQANVVFGGYDGIQQFQNLTKTLYFPVLWAQNEALLPEEARYFLKLALYTMPLLGYLFCFFLIGFGAALIIVALVLSVFYTSRNVRPLYKPVEIKALSCKDFSSVKKENEKNGSSHSQNGLLNGVC